MSDQRLTSNSDQPVEEGAVSRRQFLKLAGMAGAAVVAAGGLGGVLAACGDATTTTTAAEGTTTTAAAVTSTSAAAASQVIKMGMLTDFSIPPLVNTRKGYEAVVDWVNAAGGWKVGDTTYTLELTSYDTKSDPNTARSAVERLMSQDKVTVIFGDQTASNWVAETEAAKVLALLSTPLTDVYKPEYKYSYVTSKLPTEAPVRLGWLSTYSGKPVNKYVLVFPDDMPGQNQMKDVTSTLDALGAKYETVSFPATTTDFSAVATKTLSLNGDCVIIGGATIMFAQVYRALKAGEYTGFATITAEQSLGELDATIPLTELDGTIMGLNSWDSDSPNEASKETVDAWTKKYGKWEDANFDIDGFYAFKAALFAAGSADNDKMGEALGGGLTFDGPHGASKMIPRADAGVPDRTVCMIMEYANCTLAGGKVTNVKSVPLADAEQYALTCWKNKKV
ncbi:MAG: ABC transporter substrate-binding protein [Armatimonadetes bacterium]|nr:ABC transporter substrate-binding protein [Armatimonadota bacterium]